MKPRKLRAKPRGRRKKKKAEPRPWERLTFRQKAIEKGAQR